MSPLNRGPPLGTRNLPAGARPLPPPRFGGPGRPPNMSQRGISLPPPPPPMRRMIMPMGPMIGPDDPRRRRPPPLPQPPRQGSGGGCMSRLNSVPPLFPGGPRPRAHPRPLAPIAPPMMPRGPPMLQGPLMSWPRRIPPPMRHPVRYNMGNGNVKSKPSRNAKKFNNRGESDLIKKPWMTDEIRHEIQKKTRLYLRAKKIKKNTVEWQEFRDTRNKVTRMIRDAKNEYLAKHPEQDHPDEEETQNQEGENCVSPDDERSHYCEVCDKDFSSKDTLLEHQSTHMTCGIDGCTFSAHPLLVEKHISMQHRTGLYQRMKDLSEDLEKWIMERKKRYPTKVNINLRKAEELEKLQRGEIIKRNSNVKNVHTRMKKMENMRQKKRKPRKRYAYENNNDIQTDTLYRGLCPFPGISVLEDDDKACLDEQTDLCEEIIDISDEDDIPQTSMTLESTNTPTISLLSNLVADYESEDNDEGPEEVPVKRIKIEELQDKIKNTDQEEISDIQKCENENDKLNNNKPGKTVVKYQDQQKHEKHQRVIDNKNNNYLYRYHDKLLEKLLSRSIQHERNLICQCVKYIIENNFFDSN
ncbi:LOW QUALITY PROTEIN: nuclear fragile X mental retardation-interacting protein 1-like [Nylanderia fulva]|uniref:LOW QUALITY PROTEIN: nuclear fragile X mental retardation-interacting protein 1-like n=1 Tax=Nylanderia fulva TaxID=613905 RepID=UPI0010FB67C3|nr:LOW QUALITY PROTEIN: nuclear fragile X mental retardation-interacting protein 1-like [Nylanderia fulva]